jgi:transcriptional regulator of met regulon
MPDIEAIAGTFYETYCNAVGGKAFSGEPLPSWNEFRGDENKKIQSDAWIKVAELALSF